MATPRVLMPDSKTSHSTQTVSGDYSFLFPILLKQVDILSYILCDYLSYQDTSSALQLSGSIYRTLKKNNKFLKRRINFMDKRILEILDVHLEQATRFQLEIRSIPPRVTHAGDEKIAAVIARMSPHSINHVANAIVARRGGDLCLECGGQACDCLGSNQTVLQN